MKTKEEEIQNRVKKLKKESESVFKELLEKRDGFPLMVVYGTGEGRELILNVAHANFLDEEMKIKISEVVNVWVEGKNPQSKVYEEDTVNIEDTKDNLYRTK